MEVTSKPHAQANLTARKKKLLAHRRGGRVGPRANLEVGRTERFLDSAGNRTSDRPATSLVVIPTTLYVPEYFGYWTCFLPQVNPWGGTPTHLGAVQAAVWTYHLMFCSILISLGWNAFVIRQILRRLPPEAFGITGLRHLPYLHDTKFWRRDITVFRNLTPCVLFRQVPTLRRNFLL